MDLGTNPNIDLSVWNNTHLLRQGIYLATGGNEFAECVHGVIPITNSPAGYEKSLRHTEVWTHDPCDYTPGSEKVRDAVGSDTRAIIKSGNMQGSAFAQYSRVAIEDGADGIATVHESCVLNNGADQPLLDQRNSKYNYFATSAGNSPVTAVLYPINSPGKYHLGFVMRTDSFTDHPDDAYLALYQAGSNDPIFRIHPKTGMITHIAGRPVVVRRINGFDCLTLG